MIRKKIRHIFAAIKNQEIADDFTHLTNFFRHESAKSMLTQTLRDDHDVKKSILT